MSLLVFKLINYKNARDGIDFDLGCRLSNLCAHDTNGMKWGTDTLPSTTAMGSVLKIPNVSGNRHCTVEMF